MQSIGMNNLMSMVIGVFLILSCCVTSYIFQKRLFSKYKNKVKSTTKK